MLSSLRVSNRLVVIVFAAGAALAASALAEPPAGAPLGGPPVKERDVPGADGGFAGMAQPLSKKDRGGDAIPHRVFMESVRAALGEQAPENVRLSAEQRQTVEAASKEYQAQMQSFMQQHTGEFGGAAGGARGRGRGGERNAPQAGAADAPPTAEQKAAMESLKALREQMPKPDDAHTKIWATLRPEQKQALEGKLDEFKKNRAAREGEAFAKRALAKGGKAGAEGKKRGADAGQLDPAKLDKFLEQVPAARREAIKKKLESMTPEKRQKFIDTMRERRGGKGRGTQPAAQPGASTPAG